MPQVLDLTVVDRANRYYEGHEAAMKRFSADWVSRWIEKSKSLKKTEKVYP